ncbi:MAG TPA: glucose-1-phosphate cytidylyltransferase, partial [Tepidisphaeraceae bacterium]
KPMVEIGGRPILWHILSIYASHGFNEFIIACGYKGEFIKEYFCNFRYHNSDISIDMKTGSIALENNRTPNWRITLVDTGLETQTGGRIRRLAPWLDDEPFMMTYGDGVGNIDIKALSAFHRGHKGLATVTAVRPPARFGGLSFDGDRISDFSEKPQIGEGWINGGFMVLDRKVLDYIDGDDVIFEKAPLERLARDSQLYAFRHEGFWQPMDTLREKHLLESMWQSGKAPWKTW